MKLSQFDPRQLDSRRLDSRRQPIQYFITVGAIAIAYFGTARFTLSTLELGFSASPVWPPAGIALAALLLQGVRYWPGILLGSLWLNVSLDVAGLAVLGASLGNTLQAIAGATLLRRLRVGLALERLHDALGLIVVAGIIAPVINATLGTSTATLAGIIDGQQFASNWGTIWLGDSTGILVVTPLLLVMFAGQPLRLSRHPSRPKVAEGGLWLSLLVVVSWAVFFSPTGEAIAQYPLEYLPLPFIVAMALRLGPPGAVLASFLVNSIAIGGSVAGYGPFVARALTTNQAVLLLQAFTSVTTITALVLAASVTERLRAEERLRRSEASLINAQSIARLGHWDFDADLQQWSWSEELYRLLGFMPRAFEPSQKAFFEAVHPDDRDRVHAALERALWEQEPYQIEYRVVLPDGQERILFEQAAVQRDRVTGTVQDVTQRKQVEAQLRLTAERDRLLGEIALRIRRSLNLEEILDNTVREVRQFLQADRVFISWFEPSGRGEVVAESVDARWPATLGWQTDAAVYPEIEALVTDDHIRVVNDTSQIERSPFLKQYHDCYQVRAGIGVPILLGGRLVGLLIVNQCSGPRQWQTSEVDLIDQLATQVAIAIQQAELYQQVQKLNANLEQDVQARTHELQQKMQELEELSQLRDVFLHAVSHDLRTTVMGTLLVLKNLQTQPGDSVALSRAILERMIQCAEQQLSKLNSLSEVYALKTQGMMLNLEPLPLNTLIQSVLLDLEPLVATNQATVTNLAPLRLPLIRADATQLRRVFESLLTNALKHNPPGVGLTLQAAVETNWIRCTVQDDGVGLSPEQCDRLFELRLGGSQARQLTGISLGLYLCRQIVAAHGGAIGVDSEPGQGASFWFTIPLANP